MQDRVTVSLAQGIADVRLNRPDKMNALDAAMFDALVAAGRRLRDERGLRAVVLSGEGRGFCAGLDVASFMGGGGGRSLFERSAESPANLAQRAAWIWTELPVPVIAAIHGWCIGGGVDLICACDARLASADARFSVRETRLGMVADVGTLARLPQIVGQGAARILALTGDDVDAARAKDLGLVTDVYPSRDALMTAAADLAARIARNSPLAVQGTKAVLNAASEKAADESLRTVALWNAGFLASHDLREAMAAFVEKREPKFQGR